MLVGGEGGAEAAEEASAAAEELSATVQELSGAASEILVAIDQISRGLDPGCRDPTGRLGDGRDREGGSRLQRQRDRQRRAGRGHAGLADRRQRRCGPVGERCRYLRRGEQRRPGDRRRAGGTGRRDRQDRRWAGPGGRADHDAGDQRRGGSRAGGRGGPGLRRSVGRHPHPGARRLAQRRRGQGSGHRHRRPDRQGPARGRSDQRPGQRRARQEPRRSRRAWPRSPSTPPRSRPAPSDIAQGAEDVLSASAQVLSGIGQIASAAEEASSAAAQCRRSSPAAIAERRRTGRGDRGDRAPGQRAAASRGSMEWRPSRPAEADGSRWRRTRGHGRRGRRRGDPHAAHHPDAERTAGPVGASPICAAWCCPWCRWGRCWATKPKATPRAWWCCAAIPLWAWPSIPSRR